MAVRFRNRNRNAEIADAHEAVIIDEHVRGLQIAVKNTLRVRRGETGAELSSDVDDFLLRQPAHASKHGSEVFAPDELHREEDHPVGFADVEHADTRPGE